MVMVASHRAAESRSTAGDESIEVFRVVDGPKKDADAAVAGTVDAIERRDDLLVANQVKDE